MIQECLGLLRYRSRRQVASMEEVGIRREWGERHRKASAGRAYVATKPSGGWAKR